MAGFPYPESVALASLLESVVRANGAVPATIGILGGEARVGLSTEELVELASAAEKKSALKVSRRDLGYICGLVGGYHTLHMDTRLTTVGTGREAPSWWYNRVWHYGTCTLGRNQGIWDRWIRWVLLLLPYLVVLIDHRWCTSRGRKLHGHLGYVNLVMGWSPANRSS